jgi:hypothetical protein
MQRKRLFLRVTAVLSSLSLMAGFVAYSAGALDSLIPGRANTQQREMMSSSKLRTLVTPSGPAATLPGSKSDRIAVPSPTLETTIPAEKPIDATPILMPGSKSAASSGEPFAAAIGNAVRDALAQQPAKGRKQAPAMMSGSKYIVLPSATTPGGDEEFQK